MGKSFTIQKNQSLLPGSDFGFLRQKGMEYIEDLGSKLWTDYNIHDPGITLLEALCYALTDLGYRTSFDIKDLLALKENETADADGQFPDDKRQALFTARNILTINPCTTDDFRKLLINIDGIKNGWLFCKTCPCDDIFLYANCTKSILQYSKTDHRIIVRGLYDVLLEFEEEEKSGNLNSGKIKYNFNFQNGLHRANAQVEMRLPSWAKLEQEKGKYLHFRNPLSEITNVSIPFISGSVPVVADIPISPESVLDSVLRKPVFANVEVTFKPDKNNAATEVLVFADVPMNIWFRTIEERRALELNDLKTSLMDKTAAGILSRYLKKIKRADEVIADTIQVLHAHRNLAEDYCTIKAIEVEDIAICTDMEVESSADIEAVLAEAYYRIDQYMSPDIKFYSLQELLDANTPVDEIFEGPALDNGFINNDELASASLRKVLYTSDVINLVMDIPGVKSVSNFVFARYNDQGFLVESEPWEMNVTANHQPRLYILASKVLVFKNGLPFLPDMNELMDSMQVVFGDRFQSKFSVLDNDLPVPHGKYYELESYFPVQNSLPQTYGTGVDGLPDSASDLRKAQAKQLKAYLLFFEQLLVNYLSQLANIKELFALDNGVSQTYFSHFLQSTEIDGLGDLLYGLDGNKLQQLMEDEDVFLSRRNRFLDHLLARFAETFNDYALMLYSYSDDKTVTETQLIEDKISFLQKFPVVSRDRSKSFNYKDPSLVCSEENKAGLVQRIEQLLGYGNAFTGNFKIYEVNENVGDAFEFRWRLIDDSSKIYLSSKMKFVDENRESAWQKARDDIDIVFPFLSKSANFKIEQVNKFTLRLVNDHNEIIATRIQTFNTQAEAETARDEIISFAKEIVLSEKIFVVEHVLLRPRNIPDATFPEGDPLLTVCLNANCSDCDERDPYSFRITVVLNGEDGLANKGIEFRRFAEQTIRMETPGYLGLKICWVSKKDLQEFGKLYCAWLGELAKAAPDAVLLHDYLVELLKMFTSLKNVYPQATLHDCVDGNDDNRVFLGSTAIISEEELNKQIEKKKNEN